MIPSQPLDTPLWAFSLAVYGGDGVTDECLGLQERLGLDDLCRYAVASFEDGVTPKHEDATMWQRALGFCTLRLKAEPAVVIVLDDVPENLATARIAGIGTRHVQVLNPAQMWSDLGEAGLYLPLARQDAGGR